MFIFFFFFFFFVVVVVVVVVTFDSYNGERIFELWAFLLEIYKNVIGLQGSRENF